MTSSSHVGSALGISNVETFFSSYCTHLNVRTEAEESARLHTQAKVDELGSRFRQRQQQQQQFFFASFFFLAYRLFGRTLRCAPATMSVCWRILVRQIFIGASSCRRPSADRGALDIIYLAPQTCRRRRRDDDGDGERVKEVVGRTRGARNDYRAEKSLIVRAVLGRTMNLAWMIIGRFLTFFFG